LRELLIALFWWSVVMVVAAVVLKGLEFI